MSRPLRINYENAWYHVMNRGRGRQVTFPSDDAYQAFLQTLEEAVQRFTIEIHAFCLMPNHYHLLIKTPLANLSRAMRHIDGIYTQRHNRLTGTDGPLFRGRYKAIVVDADEYLLSLSRYIHRNPIEAKKPLADDLNDWPWSSYPSLIQRRSHYSWLHRDATYELLGKRSRYQAFKKHILDDTKDEVTDFFSKQRLQPVLGGADFIKRIEPYIKHSREMPKREMPRAVDMATVLRTVAEAFGFTVEELLKKRPCPDGHQIPRQISRHIPRQMAMLLCRDYVGMTLNQMAEQFGGMHYSTVSHGIKQLEKHLKKQRIRKIYRACVQALDSDAMDDQ